MEPLDDRALAAELRALRPGPRPEFAAELDARAAAGFPAAPGPDAAPGARRGGRLAALAARLRARPRLLLAPGGALAAATVLVATVLVLGGDGGGESTVEQLSKPATSVEADGGGAAAGPGEAAGRLAEPEVAPSAAEEMTPHYTRGAASVVAPAPPRRGNGPYAAGRERRAIERSAQLFLTTEPEAVREAAGKAFAVVHRFEGIVLESSVAEGGAGEAGASFELLIPSGRLGDALAGFSAIAEVASREEQTADITARTIGVGERLQDANASIEGLLAQLAAADTDAERAAAEAELRGERLRAAGLRARLAELKRRANLSRVSLTISSSDGGAVAAPSDEDGSWGIGAALGDAGRVLEVAAGVALVGLAILSPFALLALLAWAARRATLRRARERALG